MEQQTIDKEQYLELAVKRLKDAGNRITRPRKTVLACLAEARAPLSPREIIESITESDSTIQIDKVSVYRILETLLDLGLVHQVFPSGNYMACSHLSCNSKFHLLTSCSTCGLTSELDIPRKVAQPMIDHLNEEHSFKTDEHHIQIDGLCKNCQSKE